MLDVWQEGRELHLTFELMRPRMLVPPHLDNADPSFFVLAGVCPQLCHNSHLPAHHKILGTSTIRFQTVHQSGQHAKHLFCYQAR